ncbi:PTS sugar transporter [Herbiconiux moechotypicola]|uniref:PTS lactose transporter subunit IIB n=1 Tax=Herbiconiux moechotypicola TaxID=637393 RepID=A0ABN3DT81_9MICO|nr:PTS sugar transporter [Herbiconiux moechotypicola]MCS5730553.1 PTS sugar transporter [Herbiconiux moechotypicola]
MDKVLIICGAGASSTFLALRVRRVLRARGLDLTVEAGTVPDLDDRIGATDVLLVGPHLGEQFGTLHERAAREGVPAALLPDTAFGPEGAEQTADLVTGLLDAPRGPHHTLKAEQI